MKNNQQYVLLGTIHHRPQTIENKSMNHTVALSDFKYNEHWSCSSATHHPAAVNTKHVLIHN